MSYVEPACDLTVTGLPATRSIVAGLKTDEVELAAMQVLDPHCSDEHEAAPAEDFEPCAQEEQADDPALE